MAESRTLFSVSGKRLRYHRERLMLNQRELAELVGISEGKLRAIETNREPRVYATTFRRIAKAINLDLEEAKADLCGSVAAMLGLGYPIGEAGESGPVIGVAGIDPPPQKVRWLDGIPIVDLSLAAGPWADVEDVPDVVTAAQIDKGLFGVRLSGDSMAPEYPNGQTVIFQVLREGLDEAEIGKDHYFQKEDGGATFKRLVAVGESRVTLKAINERKYPREMHVNRSQIVRVARAMFKGERVD